MNIFEMLSFDFQEFVTSPAGILIILGILCLLVGIVMFLKEGKKKTKDVEEVKQEPTPQTPVQETEVKQEPVVENKEEKPAIEPVQEATPIVVAATNDGVNEIPVPNVNETLNISEPAQPAVAPVEEVKPESLDATPVVETPAVEAPVAPVVEAPVVEAPTVYGGASPEVSAASVVEEKPKEIYGGANPLENTAPIPTPAVNEAYATPSQVEPAVEAPVVEAPVVEAPVAPVAETPVAPAVEEKKEEIEKLEF